MAEFGLALLALVALLVVSTGMPVFVALLIASACGALVGVLSGAVPLALLGALPGRIVGLLEHDLLQAMPLFVLIGALLDRLPLAGLLYRGANRLAPAPVAALGLSALLAPMNGSVGASVTMLSRVVAPRLLADGVSPARTTALVSTASTLGVLIPPSLVLLLLGDAMMRAHTEALARSGSVARVLNTQDLMHGVLPAAGLVLLTWFAVAAWQGRGTPRGRERLAPSERAAAIGCVAVLLALLGGVAAGWFYAVEAAATGGVLLLVAAMLSGKLGKAQFDGALRDALQVTGSLFALFVAATTFTLVLRALGTDWWLQALFEHLPNARMLALPLGLGALLVCGLVLDAFELIFVVVPILMPPVLVQVPDATWVAVLSLITLQAGFLLPPLGYAVMMSSAQIVPHASSRDVLRVLAPTLAGLLAVAALVAWQPRLVHAFDAPEMATAPSLTPEEIEQRMREAPRGVE